MAASLACLALVAPAASAGPLPEDIDDYEYEGSSLNPLVEKALSETEREGMYVGLVTYLLQIFEGVDSASSVGVDDSLKPWGLH